MARNNSKTPVRVAWATALLSISLGVTLWSAQSGAQMPDEAMTLRPRTAMKQARDLFKRGEYEKADALYQQALAGQADLSATERQDLGVLMKQNANALQGRQDGAILVQRAQQALQQGKAQEASNLLKAANANQYLSASDRQRANSLSEHMRGGVPVLPSVNGNVAVTQKNGMTTVDTGITINGNDAKAYLVAARQALAKGEIDFAETLVKDAERLNTGMSSWLPWGDSPTKVRRDIQSARTKQMQTPTVAQTSEKKDGQSIMSKTVSFLTPPFLRDKKSEDKSVANDTRPPEFPVTPRDNATAKKSGLAQDLNPMVGVAKSPAVNSPAPNLPPSVARAQARKLIDDGYKALQNNDLETARKCADDAKALRPDLEWNERNPDRLLAEIQRRAGSRTAVAASTTTGTPADARNWIKQARAALQKEQIDDADKLTARAAAVTGVRWGLFEDSPERLRADIQETRARHNRDQAAKLMVDARKAYAKGNLKEAKDRAFQAKELHGPYSVWDFSERPQKLLDEIARAEAGNRKGPILPDEIPAPTNPAAAVAGMPPGAARRVPVQLTSGGTQQPNRFKATQLIAEARDLERRGLLVEARAKAAEADALGVTFGADEDSPKNVMLSLSSKSDQRIQQLLQQAADWVRTNPNDPTAFMKAEGNITDARKLAQSFGLDPAVINQSALWLQQAAAKAGVVSPIVARNVTNPGLVQADIKLPTDPQALRNREIGLEKLDKARLEIKAGNYPLARRIAEEAYNPTYYVQVEAGMVLRTIDAEENQHHTNVAMKNFEIGMEAFHRKDYRRAYQLWDTVDVRLLPMDKQRQLAELMQDARGVIPVKNEVSTSTAPGAGQNANQLSKWTAMEEIQAQKLRERSQETMNKAWKLVQDKKIPQAVDTLKGFLEDMKNAPVNPDRVVAIRRQVESKLQQYNTLLAQQALSDQARRTMNPETINNVKIAKLHEEVAELMKDARAKYKEGRYEQSLVLAKRAKELDGDNAAIDAMINMATTEVRQREWDRNKGINESVNQRELNNDMARDVSSRNPLALDKDTYDRASKRKAFSGIYNQTKDPVERMIEQKLELPNSFYWKDAKLDDIIQDLKTLTGINVVPNLKALRDANISLDMPMSLNVENVKTKSALNVLLEQAKLTWVIKDQVLQITTVEDAKGKTKSMIHAVADLIVPVDNHQTPECFNLTSALMRHIQKNGAIEYGGSRPYMPPQSLPLSSGLPTGHYGNSMMPDNGTNASGALPSGAIPNPNTKLMPGQTMETLLIDLIKNTVAQNSWTEQGGPGTIQFYPLGMALIVNQTLEVQEEVAALLQALRRLQDLEIAIEMRLVNVSEAFFERMGLDFDINIKTPHSRGEQNLVTGQFAPFQNVNRNLGVKNLVSGMTPAGTLTPDLNVPIRSSSYDFTIPPFGGFPGTIGSDGGLSLGLAFLNDIQVFMFLEAASGDRRTNVMQAPKITMFNGQVATMTISDNQFFLTDVQIAVPNNGNQLFFVPNQAPYPLGVNITVSAVVSADRRFVRVNLTPSLTNLASATVPLFPVQIVVPQFFDGPGSGTTTNTQPSVFQMFFQQPAFTTITMSTTVNVPDGGTVLLGGLKTLSESRNEFGPPILSKIPYLNRLFRNIGYGRETQSLMIMVTPRIIINEEEEQILFGQANIPRP